MPESLPPRSDSESTDAVDLTRLLCECRDRDCRRYLPIDLDEYRAVRDRGAVVLPGHESPTDRVVVDADGYRVVQEAE